MRNLASVPLTVVLLLFTFPTFCQAQPAIQWQVGLGKVDVTPAEPVQLSGYASRSASSTGVADPLHARAMVIRGGEKSMVLASVDSILVPGVLTVEIAAWLSSEHGIPRSQFVLSSTHSHAAPHIHGGLNNLLREASTDEQTAATQRYTQLMTDGIKQAITQALGHMQPAKLAIGESQATFAVQRRVLSDGVWSGFGERPDGPVDHRVRVLRAIAPDGRMLGGAYMYANHCTTLGGDFNQVSGDWAGLSASRLEAIHANSVFLPIIGCGADANPSPRGTYEFAQQHAAEMVDAVQSALTSDDLTQLNDIPETRFGYAGIAPEQPTQARIDELAASDVPNQRRWAAHMTQVRQEMGRLPESYPMPIHTWQFGNTLTWVFLGGEVVVDYQYLIEKELPTAQTWVAAYTDDVFAYVASESMRPEGGYEVDSSMIYYLQPGRWQTGTQSLILRRVSEIVKNESTESEPLSASQALAAIRVPDGFRVDLVASEPQLQDPINVAFGLDGRVWVVEMADYPQGTEGGGRVKWLRDNDGDGVLEQSQVFQAGLSYPSSVMPWRDGALIISAPNIIYAIDTDQDGIADQTETLLSGVGEANPQHRASGFEIGLDGWLHFGAGDGTQTLTSTRNGQQYHVHGHDVAWNPDTGEVRTTSGETQFVRSRDAFGNWFGNSNSLPIYQYVIESRYQAEHSVDGGGKQHLLSPPVAPPVYPRSKIVDRFNDLFALNRFTSACSSTISRVPSLGTEGLTDAAHVGFVCEPVHNLVARIAIYQPGSHFIATRHPADVDYDFFTSTDPWSRPVRVVNAPDGSLWVVDMVRKVIEHPQWIPTAWQERLDLRAGANLGRIYRVYRDDAQLLPLHGIGNSASEVLPALASENGAVRDLALMRILESDELPVQADVRRMAGEHSNPAVRVSALGCLLAKGWLTEHDLIRAFEDVDPRVVRSALEFGETAPGKFGDAFATAFAQVPNRKLGLAVDLQWILTSTRLHNLEHGAGLQQIASRSRTDTPVNQALSLIQAEQQALAIASGMLARWRPGEPVSADEFSITQQTLSRLWKRLPARDREALATTRFKAVVASDDAEFSASDLLLLSVLSSVGDSSGVDESLREQVISRSGSISGFAFSAVGASGLGQLDWQRISIASRRAGYGETTVELFGKGLKTSSDQSVASRTR
ncbi:MAG: neutral/alkaline non-lysosomal ceramidase N-terminal domain-containing protein [Pirellulaceae bacterium]